MFISYIKYQSVYKQASKQTNKRHSEEVSCPARAGASKNSKTDISNARLANSVRYENSHSNYGCQGNKNNCRCGFTPEVCCFTHGEDFISAWAVYGHLLSHFLLNKYRTFPQGSYGKVFKMIRLRLVGIGENFTRNRNIFGHLNSAQTHQLNCLFQTCADLGLGTCQNTD